MYTEMRILSRPWIMTLSLMAGVLAAPMMLTACATNPQYAEYHGHHDVWTESEVSFYVTWESDTHRQHRNWNDRDAHEQQEYWSWRHSHSG
jgi:hypothetical protein